MVVMWVGVFVVCWWSRLRGVAIWEGVWNGEGPVWCVLYRVVVWYGGLYIWLLRYLETLVVYQNKSADVIRGKLEDDKKVEKTVSCIS